LTGHFRGFLDFSLIIIVHECGHILMALIYGWKIEKVLLLPFGALTIFNEDLNRPLKEEFLILIMGPIFQIIFNVFHYNDYSNLILFFNLLPIYPLDGSKLLNVILNKFISFKKSHLITVYISFLWILFLIVKWQFNLVFLLIIGFILKKVIYEYQNHENIFNRFLLERYMKDFKFKKIKKIHSLNVQKMHRDDRHLFYDGQKYITERERLRKRFDLTSKM
jgi:stage IV sporulation protein FB